MTTYTLPATEITKEQSSRDIRIASRRAEIAFAQVVALIQREVKRAALAALEKGCAG